MEISAKHPDLSTSAITYLSAKANAAATALGVQSNAQFSANDYIVIGLLGTEKAEIRKISSVSGGSTINVASDALVFEHPSNTPITLIKYNQVKVYSSATETGTFTALSGSPFAIDAERQATVIEDSLGTSTTWYKISYYNSQTSTESAQSDAMQGSGPKRGSVASLIGRVRRDMNVENDTVVTDDDIIDYFNECLDDIQGRKGWPKQEASGTINSAASTATYPIADSLPELLKVKQIRILEGSVYYFPEYKDPADFDQLNSISGVTASIPTHYTIWDEDLVFYPAFSATGTNNILVKYFKRIPYITNSNDVPAIAQPELLRYYACMMIAAKRRDKDQFPMWAQRYEKRLGDMISTAAGKKQRTRFVKIKRPGIFEPLDPNRFNTISTEW